MTMDSFGCVPPGDLVSTPRRTVSRAGAVKLATGLVDVDPRVSQGISAIRKTIQKLNDIRMATWNVPGLNQTGKL